MEVGAFYLPALGSKEEIMEGMAGKRTDLYQKMLSDISQQCQYMDEHGYYGAGFTEHHFHIEGEEVSTNPVMLDLYFGMQCKNMKFGQLGSVLPSQNPINHAENLAMLDQMLQGRAFAGFARGYQPRWVNVLGQQVGLGHMGDGEDYEQKKKDLYYEHFDIVMKALENDTFSHKGDAWEIPTPDIKWAAADITRKYGQGVDENDIIQEIGIAPPPYNKRKLELFQPFSTSESSIKWAVERGVVPITIMCHPEIQRGHMLAAQEAANEAGLNYKFGQGLGMTREVIVADTDEEAEELARNAGAFIWLNFFAPFGFNAAIAAPGEGPFDVPATFEATDERGLVIYGSPDTVNRKLEKLFDQFPVDYFWNFTYNGLLPQKAAMRSFELQTEKVWPNFTNKIK
jgi:alkanesulfonate monooxygenase SsuD/methylene tetrahydromethanopterin reductase-like flavin-dependent oxidoreductase (luciferase family)